MRMLNLLPGSIALAAALLATAASAQTMMMPDPANAPTVLTVSAEGRVSRAPDIVELSGGVVTMAPTAAAAMAENARRMNAVVAAVRQAGIAERDIQTTGLSLQPQYRYEENKPPILTGYQANNTVALRVRRIADAGKLLDTLVSVGANQIQGPNFQVEAADAALDEARVMAVKTARARAELYAKAAGMKIKRITAISEGGGYVPSPRAMMMTAKAEMSDAPTPVAPGEVALNMNVTMSFQLE
jgi:uncharacterized protein YggE